MPISNQRDPEKGKPGQQKHSIQRAVQTSLRFLTENSQQ